MILICNGATHPDLILDLIDLVLLYEKRICLYMRNILFLENIRPGSQLEFGDINRAACTIAAHGHDARGI